jgi:hypothetical protein
MIKRGLNLFTSTGEALENGRKTKSTHCCDICITPSLVLCQFICKYRQATVREWNNEDRDEVKP